MKIRSIHKSSTQLEDVILEDVTLEDIISSLIKLSIDFATLEIENNRAAYRRIRDGIRYSEKLVKAMKDRIRYEILPDINKEKIRRRSKGIDYNKYNNLKTRTDEQN